MRGREREIERDREIKIWFLIYEDTTTATNKYMY